MMPKRHMRTCHLLVSLWIMLTVMSCSHERVMPVAVEEISDIDTLFGRAEDSLVVGNKSYALRAIARGKSIAQDSDDYYLMEVLYSKYCFSIMNADSFLYANKRLDAYLERTKGMGGKRYGFLAFSSAMQKGVYYSKMVVELDSALVNHERALALVYGYAHEPSEKLMVLSNIADIYRQLGAYDKCALYYKWGLEYADSMGTTFDSHVMLTMGIALAYTSMEDFGQSREWWDRTGKMYPRMNDYDKFLYLNNRGNDYYLQGKYAESRKCFEGIDALFKGKKEYEWEYMFGHVNLSDIYLKMGEVDKARSLIAETEPFFSSLGFTPALFYLQTQKIEMLIKTGDIGGALALARESIPPPGTVPEQKKIRLRVLEQLYEKAGDISNYVAVSERYHELVDSLAGNNMKMRFSEKLMQYQRDTRILRQQRTIEEKDASIRYATASVFVIIVLLVLVLIIFALNRRQRKLKEVGMLYKIGELRMKNMRNRISPHFVYNALSHEMLAQMDGREVNLDDLVSLLRYGNRMSSELCTSLKEEFDFIDYYVKVESRSLPESFCYVKDVAEGIDVADVRIPSMTIQIFVENALKHGLKGKKDGGMLKICVTKRETGTLIEVVDNGSGTKRIRRMEERGVEPKEVGTGMAVVARTVEFLNVHNSAKMEFGGEDGPAGGYRSWLYVPDGYEYGLNIN